MNSIKVNDEPFKFELDNSEWGIKGKARRVTINTNGPWDEGVTISMDVAGKYTVTDKSQKTPVEVTRTATVEIKDQSIEPVVKAQRLARIPQGATFEFDKVWVKDVVAAQSVVVFTWKETL